MPTDAPKDSSTSNKLGFMIVFQTLFALNVTCTLALLVFASTSNLVFDFDVCFEILNLLLDAVSFWLILRRKKAARTLIIAFSLFNIVVGTGYNIIAGSFDPLNQLISCAFDIVLLVYFSTSKRAKAVLVMPFDAEQKELGVQEARNFYQPKTWAFWRNLIIYFCIFSVVGHWMEAGYCTLIRFGILPGIYDPNSGIWRDWLYPFCVYGFGAVACVLLLFPVKNWLQSKFKGTLAPLFLSFVIGGVICCGIELAMGLMLNQPLPDGSLPLWDYRDMFCNFMGQICLQNGVAFGLVATLMTWIIYPSLERLLGHFGRETMNVVFIVVVVLFAILFLFYCINVVIPDLSNVTIG